MLALKYTHYNWEHTMYWSGLHVHSSCHAVLPTPTLLQDGYLKFKQLISQIVMGAMVFDREA